MPLTFSAASERLGSSVYSRLSRRLATHDGPTSPLHIGDTWMEPVSGARMQDLAVSDHPGMHRYGPTRGLPALVDAIASRAADVAGEPVTREQVLVTAGATGGLAALVGALVGPGDRVVILAPHWPLIAGMVRAFGGEPVVLPFFDRFDDPEVAAQALDASIDPRTVAVYWNSPSNPAGRVLPRSWLEALVRVARARDVWILADEVYEDYVYEGEHVPARALAPERTVSAHSFSKAYGMAGNRVGYLVGPEPAIERAHRIATHVYYGAPTAAQLAALAVLGPEGDGWVRAARRAYAQLGAYAADRLGLPRPQGGTFLFVDVADALDARGLDGLLEDAVDRGLLVAPGTSFGPYPTHVRLCFTSAEPERVRAGVDTLAALLGR